MEKNDEMRNFADEHLALLEPEAEWRPDTAHAFRQLQSGARKQPGVPGWVFATGAAAMVCAGLLAFPHVWKTGESAAAIRFLKDGQQMPDFNLKDSTGADFRLSDYKGKAVLLNFWATWCGGCKVEVPMLMEFENRYKTDGLAVIGISLDDDGWKAVMPYLANNKVNYRIATGNQGLAKQYGVEALPMTLLIDRQGKLAGIHTGLVEKSTWEFEIGQLLRR